MEQEILEKDLTQEEIVTRLLSSNEILRTSSEKIFITNPDSNKYSLGEFLLNQKIIDSKLKEPSSLNESSKYSFIKML